MVELEFKKILVHRNGAVPERTLPEGVTLTGSPLKCIAEASNTQYDLILVCFDFMSLRESNGLVELCRTLKKIPDVKGSPIMAMLPKPHRKLMETLKIAGVDYIGFFDPDAEHWLDNFRYQAIRPEESLKIDNALAHICPHLNYEPIDARNELVTCAAYRDRLVVGRELMGKYCHCDNHRNCKYYKNPKFRESMDSSKTALLRIPTKIEVTGRRNPDAERD